MNNNLNNLNEKYNNDKLILDKRVTLLSIFRLISFVATIVFLVLAAYSKSFMLGIIYYVLMVLFLILFIALLVIHHKYYKLYDNTLFKIASIEDYKNRRNDNWKHFIDNGSEFKDTSKYYQDDLDVFGKGSLYQYLNVSKTPYGRKAFALSLTDKDTSKEEILENEEAVLELTTNEEMHIELEALLRAYAKKNSDNRVKSMDNALNNISNEVKPKPYSIIVAILLTIMVISSIVLSIFKVIEYYYAFITVILSFLINVYIISNIKEVSSNLIPINKLFDGYSDIIRYVNNKDFKSKRLNEIKSKLSESNLNVLKEFNIINTLASSSNNILFQVVFDGLFSIDTYITYFYSKWQKNSDKLKEIIENVAKLEALLSLSVLGLAKNSTVMPSISDEFSFTKLYHPLINEDSVVDNDFIFKGLNIITGSNMSGKTTFMRTIGLNYLLFKAGAMVCAESFNAGIYSLYTSMKVTDDVSNGISTFYGEVLRVKGIIEALNDNKPMLVLIDEIFKGTNTIDRLVGAKEVALKLNNPNVLAIITTHDFELCKIDSVSNYHFLEHYKDDKILFDYKIHNGVSQTRNAIYLLKLAGIISD